VLLRHVPPLVLHGACASHASHSIFLLHRPTPSCMHANERRWMHARHESAACAHATGARPSQTSQTILAPSCQARARRRLRCFAWLCMPVSSTASALVRGILLLCTDEVSCSSVDWYLAPLSYPSIPQSSNAPVLHASNHSLLLVLLCRMLATTTRMVWHVRHATCDMPRATCHVRHATHDEQSSLMLHTSCS
jgi:hypothetical protein